MYVMNSDNTLLVSDVSIENARIVGGRTRNTVWSYIVSGLRMSG